MEVDKTIDNEEKEVQSNMENEENKQCSQTELNELLAEKDQEFEELNTRFLRLQADFMNYRKRTQEEKDGLVFYGIETMACGLLPILDNFERALGSQNEENDGFYKGICMIYEQLLNFLDNNDIKEINALYQPFDPNFHDAMLVEESEEYKEGTVIKVFEKGYILKDKVIRPSKVIVSK